MKHKYFFLSLAGLIAALVLIGCNMNREQKVETAKENVRNAKQDLKIAEAEYEKDWLQFKSDAELKIAANEKSIDTFKVEMKTASKKFKAKYEKEVAALEEKNNQLKKKISEYKYEGKDKWDEFKRAFSIDVNIVGTAVKQLFTKKN